MFFAKFFVPVVALLGAATGVFASPIAEPEPVTALVTRTGGDVLSTCQDVYNSCHPLISQISEYHNAPHGDIHVVNSSLP